MDLVKNITIIKEINDETLEGKFNGEKIVLDKKNFYINATDLIRRNRCHAVNWPDFAKSRQSAIKKMLLERKIIKDDEPLTYTIDFEKNKRKFLSPGMYIHPALFPSLMIWLKPNYSIELIEAFFSLTR